MSPRFPGSHVAGQGPRSFHPIQGTLQASLKTSCGGLRVVRYAAAYDLFQRYPQDNLFLRLKHFSKARCTPKVRRPYKHQAGIQNFDNGAQHRR